MTQSNPPGYPLPDGELGGDDLVCQLVYLPDRPEYWQALLAAVHFFSTWTAWERDDDKRGKDAAANWRAAFELTIGCWRMTCLEELISDVAAMRALMELRKDCCDDNITFDIVDEVETDIEPGVGDPPDLYGETEIETWGDWEEHVCYNAHLYVDNLKNIGNTLWEVVKENSLYLGVIAAVLALAAFAGIGAAVAYLTVSGIVALVAGSATIATFSGTQDELEAAREDIVCALITGGDLAGAVEAALGSGPAWDLFYRWVPYDTAMAIIHEGGHDGEYLPAETRDDCVCDDGPEYALRWDLDVDPDDPWKGSYTWNGDLYTLKSSLDIIEIDAGELCTWLGVDQSETLLVSRIEFNSIRYADVEAGDVRIIHDGGTEIITTYEDPHNQFHRYEEIYDPPLEITHPINPCFIFNNGRSTCWVAMGFIEIDIDIA